MTESTRHLETADSPETLRRVAIDPVSRVEGHGKVTLLLDENNRIRQARLHIVEFRGFERFIQGRPYWEVPVMVQRLCGICPVSHHLAASKALDMVVGARQLTATAEKLRRLMHYGQILQSHALHFFHLSSPDLLFGFDSEVTQRNIAGLAAAHPELAKQGILLRRFGQEVIRITSGKRIHGTGAIPGGMNKSLTVSEREALLSELPQIINWAQTAVDLIQRLHESDRALYDQFGLFRSGMLSLTGKNGELDLYDGTLRSRNADGNILLDGIPPERYSEYILEEVRPWTYMKFPFLKMLGKEEGWYKVGPLARIQNCDFIPSPLAEQARRDFSDYHPGGIRHEPLAYHWARMIELLHAAEMIHVLLDDPDILGTDLLAAGARQREGVGIIEAPRGTLIHHYRVDDNDLISMCNLIVSTTHNNQAMNEAVRRVAADYFDGREITEGLLNRIEVAIRAFDPCLSCATHALGQMPLEVELLAVDGATVSRLYRDVSGACRIDT